MKNFLLATLITFSGSFAFADRCNIYEGGPLSGHIYEMNAVLVYLSSQVSPEKRLLSIERANIGGETVHVVNLESGIKYKGETEPRRMSQFLKVEAAPGTCELSIKKFVPGRAGSN